MGPLYPSSSQKPIDCYITMLNIDIFGIKKQELKKEWHIVQVQH